MRDGSMLHTYRGRGKSLSLSNSTSFPSTFPHVQKKSKKRGNMREPGTTDDVGPERKALHTRPISRHLSPCGTFLED